jgi:signal transduction histidine kinase
MAPADPFHGPSEMHGRMRAHPWEASAVGPPGGWPQSLRALVRTLLASRYPMVLTWGPHLTQFYNDGYSRLIGDKHPAALGEDIRVTLAEGWGTLGPIIERVMATREPSWLPELLLPIERAGYREEAYFSVSHAAAENDAGEVEGMLAVCTEVTGQVLGTRRQRLLRELGVQASEARSVAATCGEVARAVGGHPLDVPFLLLYLREPDGALALAASCGVAPGGPAASLRVGPGVGPGAAGGPWELGRALEGQAHLGRGEAGVTGGPFATPVREAWVAPLAAGEGAPPLGVLVAGVSPARAVDEAYHGFLELLVGQVAAALRAARAFEDARARAEALAELDRAKTAFFSNVSHEFRTPLTLLLGPLEDALAGRDGALPPAARGALELAHRNALRLQRLVNSLLDVSRLEAGAAQAALVPVDLAQLTADLASGFRAAFERAGLTLAVDCPPLPAPVRVDPAAWEKVVLNLLSNALKFTFEGGVTVRLSAEEGQAVLTVADTGTGVPPHELPRLFERFHRVRGAQGRTHEGTGIGLALVRELALLHGGDVSAESREGGGTTLRVRVPLALAPGATPHAHVAAPQAYVEEALRWLPPGGGAVAGPGARGPGAQEPRAREDGAGGATGERPRVLVVDDNADMREYVARVLAPTFAVEAAGDGEEALEAVRTRGPYALVLTDVMMPRLGGFGLLKALREEPRTRGLPVVMLSARAGEEAAVEGLEAGADDYLVKPFSARELLARVRSSLELTGLRREVARQELQAEALRDAVRLRDDFLSIASHELRTPLAAFRLQLELVERNLPPEARSRVADRLLGASRQLGRLVVLVETLLDASQLAAGRLSLAPAPVDLAGLCAEVLERCAEEARRADVTLHLEVEGGPVWALADRSRLDQVLSNLLSNALKYAPGAPLRVRAGRAGEEAVLEVVDRGPGVAAADKGRIFERFERAVPVRQYGGFGLGLWISRQVVDAHGGRLTVSDTPGGGATFTVHLPRAAPQDVADASGAR